MADRIEVFTSVVLAGTLPAAPSVFPHTFDDGEVTTLELVYPDGAINLVGVRLTYGGDQLIPATAGEWILGNDVTLSYPLQRYPTGQRWQLTAYNLGTYPHTIQVRYQIIDFGFPIPAVPPLVAL